MPHTHATYTEISIDALKFNPKSKEVLERKKEIISSIETYYKHEPKTVLFYGFSPIVFALPGKDIYLTNATDNTKKYLDDLGVKYTYIDSVKSGKKFDWVIAGEEYFTFADTEEDQREKVSTAISLANKLVITTLRDYKNQDFKDKEFSLPLAVRNGKQSKIFLEYHDYDYEEKNSWNTSVWELDNTDSKMLGKFPRRSMFFKQLAKFSLDAGATNFYVHKNLMYKSLIKKNYEHVISISF